ncbi:glycosyltransferase [Agromyces sp. LHK192]|uniref:glycosyltransferase n=1 Tax=Agromyces sp. LHK192 TaxID=2498704 RepID=UPI000FDB0C60|nr:glycosyltransferase [Agromyces sp. LHK192]
MATDPIKQRLRELLATLAPEVSGSGSTADLTSRVARAIGRPRDDVAWLVLAVVTARLPERQSVIDLRRAIALDGAEPALRDIVSAARRRAALRAGFEPRVRILQGETLVDVQHTARTGLATGIQRVVRMTLQQWSAQHEILLVGWNSRLDALRMLTDRERENAIHGTDRDAASAVRSVPEVVVPWESTYILPELAIEGERTSRMLALAEFSRNETAVVGFDCVPLTSAETVGVGMGGAFGKNLAAVARFGRVAAISEAAANEYRGWVDMLGGANLAGPTVSAVVLPSDVGEVDDDGLERAREALTIEDLPLLLCVGSHEPRKNHLAVLAAAEFLWRKGHRFSLAFVGGNSWGDTEFKTQVAQLRRLGRPLTTVTAISDDILWGGYRIARATVFPSFNEGFGLPVAESLAVGTPVVTSAFGSMREIAAAGGALLVDPRSDADVARALEDVLFDDAVNEKLRAEALARPKRGWAEYAAELWEVLVDGSNSVPDDRATTGRGER